MTEVIIRPARPDDAQVLHTLAEATFPLACPPGTSVDNIKAFIEQNLSVEAFRSYLALDTHFLWLAYSGDSSVGYAMAVSGEPKDPGIASAVAARPTLELSKIYVLADAQGTGVSTALLAEVETFAKELGANSVWLGVNQFNERANRFYERQGFHVVGTRKFLVGDTLESDFVREKSLAPAGE